MVAAGKLLLISGLAGLVASASLSVSYLGKAPAPASARHPAVKAIVTNGLSQKLLVSCGRGDKRTVTHSAFSEVWCDPASGCYETLDEAIASACK